MNDPKIQITVRDYGTITLELYPEKAPATVRTFLKLVDENFFAGLIFHRVIKGFMIQGGGFDERFSQKNAAAIPGEFAANGFMANDLHHARGMISMARTNDPNSASSQFFIMHADAGYLDRQYAGFGCVVDGMDVVDQIANVKTGRVGWYDDVPKTPVVIESVTRVAE